MHNRNFYTYILTNQYKTVLYVGVTNNLARRLVEHYIGKEGSFTTKYQVYYLLWYETTPYILNAIAREKELKLLLRDSKMALIKETNPELAFRNSEILEHWPPTQEDIRELITYLQRFPNEREK